ncbi:MAG TPA: hypothetical protein VMG55_05670 [Stellaceae bacterium]|nr:hypothetical protein [Stellaceae bacterium]
MKRLFLLLILLLAPVRIAFAEEPVRDPGWPHELKTSEATLVYYQPQVDVWESFHELDFRSAFTLTPANEKPVVGIWVMHAHTEVNVDAREVVITDFKILEVTFPSLNADQSKRMDKLLRSFLKPGHVVILSLDRFMALATKPKENPTVTVKNDPPKIFVSYGPAILLQSDGQPVWGKVAETSLQFVVNSNWPLFFDTASSSYYLFDDAEWLTTNSPIGPWVYTNRLPSDMSRIERDPQWDALKKAKAFPAPKQSAAVPKVFYTAEPAELILFKGPPSYTQIAGTQLAFASNTDSDVFIYAPTSQYYYLAAGRWFRAANLEGPWTYTTTDLPADFAKIPPTSPAGRVLSSVPGTEEAKDAVLLAQIPTTAVIDPKKAAAEVKVDYSGSPEFKPIEGTSLSYATNTSDKVIRVGDIYYLCLQGLWFMSTSPNGPWTTASSVPQEIYTIPPSSPVYNVTYVTQTTLPDGYVQASYTAGYYGMFITGLAAGAVLASGTGYYYPPYYGYPAGAYPVYHPYAATYGVGSYYNPYTGAYGVGQGVYGPYGGAAVGASYNPYTGTYARGATAYGPYGSASVGQAYNPYTGTYARGATASTAYGSATAAQAYNPRTGTYAATEQHSNAYGQWGSSVVSHGNETVTAQHQTTSQGTEASAQSTSGAKAAGTSTAHGNTAVGKTASGNMYADHDGNVYRNTGGSWQKYSNGSWSNTSPSSSSSKPPSSASGTGSGSHPSSQAPSSNVDREAQNRERGETSNARYEGSGGGWGGSRSFGGGGRSFGGGGWARGRR